ncbi:MAG: adenosylcobinamide-phosphate synthase CbiB [Proteobacteria bacterium]|nr:adenosylcobinamide-phosphate synthase CbiB [Pseudomonadota bacterium]
MIWTNDFTPDRYQLLFLALLLDALVGDLGWLFRFIPHPIVVLGRLIEYLEKKLNRDRRSDKHRLFRGAALVGFISMTSLGAGWFISDFVAGYHFWLLELFLVAILVAQRSLYTHVRDVAKALEKEGLGAARAAVAHIVGRDPAKLDGGGVARSAIESLAENFADAVIAPVFWYLLLGLPGLFFCKAVNTMDSMLGYRSTRYLMFGKCAARLDDAVMWIPARVSVIFLVLGACVTSTGRPFRAVRTIKSDAAKHPSVNAGWPEAAMAGALDFALGGPRQYAGGIQETIWIGSGRADLDAKDIKRALDLFAAACAVNGAIVLGVAILKL